MKGRIRSRLSAVSFTVKKPEKEDQNVHQVRLTLLFYLPGLRSGVTVFSRAALCRVLFERVRISGGDSQKVSLNRIFPLRAV